MLWMRRHGWDAFGVDIDPDYIENGRNSFKALGADPTALIHASDLAGFEVNPFDVVVSYMVLEHVTDLAATAQEMRKVLQPGGVGLHLYPGRWRPVEAHVGVPFVHWFGASGRRRILEFCVQRGWDRRSHWELDAAPNAEVVDRFASYLEENTRYRSNREIVRAFQDAGFSARISMSDHRLARPQGPVPEPIIRASMGQFLTAHLLIQG